MWQLDWQRIEPGTEPVNNSLTLEWTPPTDFPTLTAVRLLFDNGAGRTFEPHAFLAGDLVGFRLQRAGLNVNDTWTKSTRLAAAVELHYTGRCPTLLCL